MRTPITYYGGKQTMLKHILPLIPKHDLYTESFCGGAALLFAKVPAKAEIINDTNMDLTTFYWVAKMYYPELKAEIDKTLHSRDMHTYAMHIRNHPEFYTSVQRAWAVWAMSKMAFASQQDGAFGYDFNGHMSQKVRNGKEYFTENISVRLEHVTIENRDALDVITTYDCDKAFHFVDPPYINSNCGHFEGSFNEQNLISLLDLLKMVKGKFMLTMYPLPLIDEYANQNNWGIHKVTRVTCASKNTRRIQEEWIICNYNKGQIEQSRLFK